MSKRWIYPGLLMLRPTGVIVCFMIREVPCRISPQPYYHSTPNSSPDAMAR